MTNIPIKRALLSVSDKTGIVELAKYLTYLGVEILSTGGTSKLLAEKNIVHKQVDEVTGLPEMLDGRVKTLHPFIHGGILGKRDAHAQEAARHGIGWIDLVVVNFYPFEQAVRDNKEMSWAEAIEWIDIGGPTMVRAAAKNFAWVGVVTRPSDYAHIIAEINHTKSLSIETRRNLAEKAFALTSHYDAMVHQYFLTQEKHEKPYPTFLDLQFEKVLELRYGENPHQNAAAYRIKNEASGVLAAVQLQGKPLSYNNILDAEAAQSCVNEFSEPACVIVKHANPCGAAIGSNIDEAFAQAYETDKQSAFGGIVALNRPCTKKIAEAITTIFMEVIIAPAFSQEALILFANKPNLRLLEMPEQSRTAREMRFITGGVLVQERDQQILKTNDLKIVTQAIPNSEEMAAMLFAWRVLKHIKSNGILLAKKQAAIGIGAGQVSRIDAVDLAVRKAGEKVNGCILASDAFFPFRDSIDRIAKAGGVNAIIQPGGSMRDDEVIAACNEHGIAMVFTGKRCFKH